MQIKGDIKEEFTFAHRCTDKAIDFLNRYKDEDFFISVSYDEPHHPFVAPKKYTEMFKDFMLPETPAHYDDLKDKPEHQKIWSKITPPLSELRYMFSEYFGCNSFVDYEIGRILDIIYEKCPDAMIVYTADHGSMLGCHRLMDKGPAMYNDIINIPFVVYQKDLAKGATCRTPVSHVDFVPTVLNYFGKEIPPCIEGKDITDIIKDPSVYRQRNVFMEYTRYEADHDGFMAYQPIRAVFDGRYKLVINLMCEDELYDLEKDPYEMQNLINDESLANVRKKLLDAVIDNMNNTRDPFRGYYWEERKWNKSENKIFGYTRMTRQREDLVYEPKQLDYNTGLEITELCRMKY